MSLTEVHARGLVEAHRAGDERAFTEIARTAYPSLYHHALRRLRDHHAAEDAVQETFVRAFRALPRFDGEFRLHAWLHRILLNVCSDEGSRRGREGDLTARVGSVVPVDVPDPADVAIAAEARESLASALGDLPDRYRFAVSLRYVDDLSYREIAVATGVSEENARARVARGRAALRRVLQRGFGALVLVLPGLRRVDPAPTGAEATLASANAAVGSASVGSVTVGSVTPLANVTSQLAGHAAQLAPTVTRLSEVSASMGGGRSTMVANVVGAVAAAMVPAAYTIMDHGASAPPPAVVVAGSSQHPTSSAPAVAPVTPSDLPSAGGTDAAVTSLATGAPTLATTNTTPRRAATTTASTPAPTLAPAVAPPVSNPDRRGAVVADGLTVTRDAARLHLSGAIGFAAVDKGADPEPGRSGTLAGTIDIGEPAEDGRCAATGLLDLVIDGRTYLLRLDGEVVEEATGESSGTRYRFVGTYELDGAADLGLDPAGQGAWTLHVARGSAGDPPAESSALRLSLGGPAEPAHDATEAPEP